LEVLVHGNISAGRALGIVDRVEALLTTHMGTMALSPRELVTISHSRRRV
jgi:hypothetical protein